MLADKTGLNIKNLGSGFDPRAHWRERAVDLLAGEQLSYAAARISGPVAVNILENYFTLKAAMDERGNIVLSAVEGSIALP